MALLRVAVACAGLLIIAGCVSPIGGSDTGPTCPRQYPEPPTEITKAAATSFAESYEETVAYNRVCDADSYGLGSTTARKKLHVEMQTNAGYIVLAQQPYYASRANADADGATRGIYYIANTTATRVSLYGVEQRSPDTYTANYGTNNRQYGQNIRLVNFAPTNQPLTITLTYTNTTPNETALHETYVLESKSALRLQDVTTRKGDYTLAVQDSANETTTYEFTLAQESPPILVIYRTPTGTIHVGRTGPTQ